MKYLSIAQTAERWGISTRRIQILCGEGRVPGAIRIGTVWGIPEDAEKPADARIKNGKYIKRPAEKGEQYHFLCGRGAAEKRTHGKTARYRL